MKWENKNTSFRRSVDGLNNIMYGKILASRNSIDGIIIVVSSVVKPPPRDAYTEYAARAAEGSVPCVGGRGSEFRRVRVTRALWSTCTPPPFPLAVKSPSTQDKAIVQSDEHEE